MDTKNFTALTTAPPLVFLYHERLNAIVVNVCKILDHAHPVDRFIARVQITQYFTGEVAASKTVVNPTRYNFLTRLDSASLAGFCIRTVVTSTSGARISLSSIGATEAAIHAAWCDQGRACNS
jgi:hypothetical protein